MTDPVEGKSYTALPLLEAKLREVPPAGTVLLRLDTSESVTVFLVSRRQLLEIGRAMIEFAEKLPESDRPS